MVLQKSGLEETQSTNERVTNIEPNVFVGVESEVGGGESDGDEESQKKEDSHLKSKNFITSLTGTGYRYYKINSGS